MDSNLVDNLAKELYEAEKTGIPIGQLTEKFPNITIDEAYAIQLAGRKLREADHRKVVGAKIGLTSKAMQQVYNVTEPNYGYITDDMVISESAPVKVSEIHVPRVEAEIAFVLKDSLEGPVSIADVIRATEGVMPSLEIVGTRYEKGKLKVQDTIADISSISKVVLGGALIPINDIDLRYIGLSFEKNGEVISTAAGAAVLGHPAAAVAWLANKLAKYGGSLRKGDIIISGSLIAACGVEAGDVIKATFDRLGSVGTRFVK